jgi:uncharacterized phage protein gp47/JayE
MELENLNAYIPVLDPRNEEEIVRQAQLSVYNASRVQLNDFSDHSPLAALLQGQAFAGAEFLYYVNKLPIALVLKFLETTGVQRRLGQAATAQLSFTLSAPLNQPFEIPAGFEVINSSGEYSFFTDELLVIPSNTISGVVQATAKETGEAYNLPAYTLNQFTQPLAFLASVLNLEPAQGGQNEEPIEETINKALKVIRRNNLVSELDFSEAAEEILGIGSRAKTIGLLGSDKIKQEPGAIHIFCLDSKGNPANSAQIAEVSRGISSRLMLGTVLYVSPMEVVDVSGDIIVKLLPEVESAEVANDLWQVFQDYLNPSSLTPGDSLLIRELEYQLRLVSGIKFIDQLKLNDQALNIAMPNQYSIPRAYSLKMALVDSNGNISQTMRGAGE